MAPPNLSSTAREMLEAAARHDHHLAFPPERLPIAARRTVVQSMLKSGMLEEIAGLDGQSIWRTTGAGEQLVLRATSSGLAAVAGLVAAAAAGGSIELFQPNESLSPISGTLVQPVAPRPTLCVSAAALLAAWDATGNGPSWLAPHINELRAAISKPTRAECPHQPRLDTKRAAVLTML